MGADEVRAKLYQFISDPMNRHDPDLDRARRLLSSLPKSAPSETATHQQPQPMESKTTVPADAANPDRPGGRYGFTEDGMVVDPGPANTWPGIKHTPGTDPLEKDDLLQAMVSTAETEGALRLLGGGLGMLGRGVLKTKPGQTAANARNALESAGVPIKKPVETFGTPPATRADALEAGMDPHLADARAALEFSAGPMAHSLMHGLLAPMAIVPAMLRNTTPFIGRAGIPAIRLADELAASGAVGPSSAAIGAGEQTLLGNR